MLALEKTIYWTIKEIIQPEPQDGTVKITVSAYTTTQDAIDSTNSIRNETYTCTEVGQGIDPADYYGVVQDHLGGGQVVTL